MKNTFTVVKKGNHVYKRNENGIKIVKNEINTNFKFYVPGCNRANVNTYNNTVINTNNNNTMNTSIETVSSSVCGGNSCVLGNDMYVTNQNEMLINYMKEIIKMNEKLNKEVKALKNEQRKCNCKCNCNKNTNSYNNSNCFFNKLSNYTHTQSYNKIAMMNIRKKFHAYYTKHKTPNSITINNNNNKRFHSTYPHKKKYITTKTSNVSNRKLSLFNIDIINHHRFNSNNVINIHTLTTPNFISGMNSSLNSNVHRSSNCKLKKTFSTHIKHISDLHKSCDDLTSCISLNVSKDKVKEREKDLNDFMKYTESLLRSNNSIKKYQKEKINIVEEYEGDNNTMNVNRRVMFSQPHSKSEERIKIIENESYYDNDNDHVNCKDSQECNDITNEDDGEIKIVGSDAVYKKQIVNNFNSNSNNKY